MARKKFISLRNKYKPKNIKVIFVLESPPDGHGYVYDPSGHVGEVLFRAFMKLLNIKPENKEQGLNFLKERGVLLLNPVYIPLNKLSDKKANEIILKNLDTFSKDLQKLNPKKDIPLILVKSNICKLLEEPLREKGFNVLNSGVTIPFPMHYHQESFYKKCHTLLKKAKIDISK